MLRHAGLTLTCSFVSKRGLGHPAARILLPSTLLLYGSTALYMASLTSYVVSINRLVSTAQQGLFSASFGDAEMTAFEHDVFKQSWMMTIALSINVRQASHISTLVCGN